MRFTFTRGETLPVLSWCAHLSRGRRVAHGRHGPPVETNDSGLVEGAWTGDFAKGELDTATLRWGVQTFAAR